MLAAHWILVALAVAAVTVRTFREGHQGETLDTALRTAGWEAARFGGVFLLLGPPLGGVLFLLFGIHKLVTTPSSIGIVLPVLLFSYFFGAVPSLVTGIVASAAHRSLATNWVALIAGLAGFVTSGLWLLDGETLRRGVIAWVPQIIAFFASGALAYVYVRRRSAALPKQPATPVDP